MNPREAADFQVQAYRRMTGEERLAIALRLYDLSCDIACEGIRQQHLGASEAQVNELLRARLQLALRS
jgi:Rv0078B-related antitoxin